MSAVIGLTEEGKRLLIADSARFGGLYILGKPRVGKSWLIINLILQDVETGHGVFFLDPHGDAIDYLLHCPPQYCHVFLFLDQTIRILPSALIRWNAQTLQTRHFRTIHLTRPRLPLISSGKIPLRKSRGFS